MLVGAEINYTPIEKTCLAHVFAIQKLRHYLLVHSMNLISRADPLKYIMSRPILGRLAKWALLLSEFEINFVPQCAIKGQALANFLADHPVPAEWELTKEFPNKEIFLVEVLPSWEMYIDGAARRNGAGVGVLFVSLRKDLLPYSFVLTQNCSNNEAEYQVILLGLGMAVKMKLSQLNIYDDLALVIKMRVRIPPPTEEEAEKEQTDEMEESFPISASENEVGDWREPISNFLRYGTLPADLRERVHIRRTAPRDATEMARTCRSCQLHADYIHQPPEPLHPTIASWPFEAWGLDIIGPITPKSDFDRQYILAATDYFSKWAEAAAYREVQTTTVADFIRTQIIYRYGVPLYIVTDNATLFRNKVIDRLCEKFRIQQWTSSTYNPTANGLAEAFNKTLCKILKKTIGAHKKSWDEKLGEALWAYKTLFRTPTLSTPYSLVYGTEVVLPLKVQLPSLRIAIREGLTIEECAQL
ncbi:hypothetical protein H6P81_015659 [Aristolochia fimbriata]|uniref:Integrase catalytic domain-containing protein n=1 Tax=Aristolochia fimbriata TaxID=158543 RepID=A0AAV7E6D0_ARIFI|nr:hypothetical protein H6P81_015659 [Aristolochia fimbriata]